MATSGTPPTLGRRLDLQAPVGDSARGFLAAHKVVPLPLGLGDPEAVWVQDIAVTRDEYLRSIVERLHSTAEPDPDLVGEVGAGDLENLIRDDGEALWPEIERLARSDPRFRRALACVWVDDSPEFDRRQALLAELGEHSSVRVGFVVEPEDFSPVPRLSWRAVEIENEPPGGQLSRLLREIADWYDREPLAGNPEVVMNRVLSRSYFDWASSQHALERLCHQVAVAPDIDALRHAARRIEDGKRVEAHAWTALLNALDIEATR